MRLRVEQMDFRRDRRTGGWICCKGKYRVWIVPDQIHHGMWRVVHPNGTHSEMVNLARAKDAAFGLVESMLFVRAQVPVLSALKKDMDMAESDL
jgi:hypothetical protein